jgi:plastocyanin
MRIKQTITIAALATLLCVASALSQEHAKVVITNNKFEPKELTIKAGSEVTWENK